MEPISHHVARRAFGAWALAALFLLACVAPAVSYAAADTSEPGAAADPVAVVSDGVPVDIAGRTLFTVRTGLGPFSAAERAAATRDKLRKLLFNPFRAQEAIVVSDHDGTTDVLAGDEVIFTVTEADVAGSGRTRQEVARERASAVGALLAEGERALSKTTLLKMVAYFAAFTLVFVLVWVAAGRLARTAERRVAGRTSAWLPTLDALAPGWVEAALFGLVRWGRFGVRVAAVLVYFTFVTGLSVYTRGVSRAAFEAIVNVLGVFWGAVVGYLPNLLFLALLAVVMVFAIRGMRLVFRSIERGVVQIGSFEPEWAMPTHRVLTILLIAMAVVVAYPYIPGAQTHAFQAVSIFLGLLVSLSSGPAVANVIAGIILTYTSAFRVGDRVRIGETFGDVVEKRLLVTRVRTVKNVEVAVPNSLVLSSHITNYSRYAATSGVILHASVTIGYEAPWRTVEALLLAAARDTARVEEEPAPFVLQLALNDFHVTYELNAHTREPALAPAIYSDLYKNIQDRFAEAGVEIMSPAYHALRDGSARTIPASDARASATHA
jgi:small-conductance mechanosensitive channel